MDFIVDILSLGTFSVFGLILLIVYIYYMVVDDEEEVETDIGKRKFVVMSEIKQLREEESLGLLTEKNKVRLDDLIDQYKHLSDLEE